MPSFLFGEESLTLLGSIKVLNKNGPTVFLFDEEHHNSKCIKQNVSNAIELINKAEVKIVGVESHSGGRLWDEYHSEYDTDAEYDNGDIFKAPINTCPEFANGLREIYPNQVYGVECEGMSNKIQTDLTVSDSPFFGTSVPDHPLHRERSRHFIRTLFELRNKFRLFGNLILNCGSNHNTHIAEWVRNGEIEDIISCQANFIRINTIGI